MWAWFEDECAFAKYRGLNPLAAAVLAELAIHIDLGSPWNIFCRALSFSVLRSFGLGFGGTPLGLLNPAFWSFISSWTVMKPVSRCLCCTARSSPMS